MLIFALTLTTVAAAVRGLWSPCGLSMLSSLNPVSEHIRRHRFAPTAAWYVLGAVVGGAALGGACAVLALGIGALPVGHTATWVAVLVASVVAVASDLRLGGWSLPVHPRQVDERWLRTYRRWIYAGGYGVQIGTGFATYIMTASVYLLAGLAALTGSPRTALVAGVGFGLIRGLTILVAAPARTPERLRVLLSRVEGAAAGSVRVLALTQLVVAGVAGWILGGPLVAGAVTVLAASAAIRRRQGTADRGRDDKVAGARRAVRLESA
jgi:hypothetical protein